MKEATHKLESQDRCHQQGPNPAYPKCHSPPKEPRTGVVNRDQIQLTMEATHSLESQGQLLSAGTKSSSPQKQLTRWRAKGRHHQQGKNPTHCRSHSLPGEPRSSARTKSSSPWKPLTNWSTKDRCHQQRPNPAHHRSHSLAG